MIEELIRLERISWMLREEYISKTLLSCMSSTRTLVLYHDQRTISEINLNSWESGRLREEKSRTNSLKNMDCQKKRN